MGIKANSVDDLDLFESYTGKDVDDYEPEEIEKIINKAHDEYKELLKIKDSDELGIIVTELPTGQVFSFQLNGNKFDYSVQPVLDLLFGESSEVTETSANTFIVVDETFNSSEELVEWLESNTPFTKIEVVEYEHKSGTEKTVMVNGTEVTMTTLSDDDIMKRRWERFASVYDEDHRVMVTSRSSRFHAKVSMKLLLAFGNYDDGNWEIYNSEGRTSIQNLVEQREEENDPTAITYVIGVKNTIPAEKVKKFERNITKLKLTSKQ